MSLHDYIKETEAREKSDKQLAALLAEVKATRRDMSSIGAWVCGLLFFILIATCAHK